MTDRDWRIFREDYEIVTKGNMRHPATGKRILPFRFWYESDLPEAILDTIRKVGYERPTGVQMQCIPLGLACKDVIGVAKTGSGKTCAFVLPMLVYILAQPPITRETAGEGPLALIMAPSRATHTVHSHTFSHLLAPSHTFSHLLSSWRRRRPVSSSSRSRTRLASSHRCSRSASTRWWAASPSRSSRSSSRRCGTDSNRQ